MSLYKHVSYEMRDLREYTFKPTFQCGENGVFLRRNAGHGMRFQHLALHTLLRRKFSPLIRKRKRRLSNEGEHNLGLIALMNILDNPLPMSHLGRRQRMHRVAQVVDRGLAHLVLVCD